MTLPVVEGGEEFFEGALHVRIGGRLLLNIVLQNATGYPIIMALARISRDIGGGWIVVVQSILGGSERPVQLFVEAIGLVLVTLVGIRIMDKSGVVATAVMWYYPFPKRKQKSARRGSNTGGEKLPPGLIELLAIHCGVWSEGD
jgi:hypothetical protein